MMKKTAFLDVYSKRTSTSTYNDDCMYCFRFAHVVSCFWGKETELNKSSNTKKHPAESHDSGVQNSRVETSSRSGISIMYFPFITVTVRFCEKLLCLQWLYVFASSVLLVSKQLLQEQRNKKISPSKFFSMYVLDFRLSDLAVLLACFGHGPNLKIHIWWLMTTWENTPPWEKVCVFKAFLR